MPNYQAESFYRAKISSSITSAAVCPITVVLSKLPNVSSWLLTISPNTEYEEIVEYGNINLTDMTINITKRWIKPSSTLLTTNWVDYNNTSYQRTHTQNDIIRGDVNHIHLNQGIGNSTLATEVWVGISKLSVAAASPTDPIVVGDNDTRLIAKTDATISVSDITTNNVSISAHWWAPKLPNDVTKFLNGIWTYTAPSAIQVYSEYHAVWAVTWTFSVTAWFQPKLVKVTSTATNSTATSMSYGIKTAASTQTITTFYQAWTSGNSNTDNVNIIYNTLSGSTYSYTCTITWTWATFTISWWSAWNGTALIEMIW